MGLYDFANNGLDTAYIACLTQGSLRERGVCLLGLTSVVTENPKLQSSKQDVKMHFSYQTQVVQADFWLHDSWLPLSWLPLYWLPHNLRVWSNKAALAPLSRPHSIQQEGTTAPPLKELARSCMCHLCLHPIGQTLVTRVHLALRETGKYSLYSR